jgi:hypothetical protein
MAAGDTTVGSTPAWNALVVGLLGCLVGGLVFGLFGVLVFVPVGRLVFGQGFRLSWFTGPSFGLEVGLFVGLFGALNAGGQACLEHLVLRLLLVRNGSIKYESTASGGETPEGSAVPGVVRDGPRSREAPRDRRTVATDGPS